MRKQLLALSLILVMLLGITAQASGPAMLPAAETEVRILSRQPPSFGPEKLA